MKFVYSPIALLHSMIMPGAAWAAENALPVSQHSLSAGYFIKLGLALLLVLAMFLAFAWIMRRVNGYHPAVKDELQVVAGLNLGSREKLVVVQVGEEQLLLGVTPGKIARLHRLAKALPQTHRGNAGDFGNKLRAALKKQDAA